MYLSNLVYFRIVVLNILAPRARWALVCGSIGPQGPMCQDRVPKTWIIPQGLTLPLIPGLCLRAPQHPCPAPHAMCWAWGPTSLFFWLPNFWTCGEPYGPDDTAPGAKFGLWSEHPSVRRQPSLEKEQICMLKCLKVQLLVFNCT